MSAFKQIIEARGRKALRTVILSRVDFADDWPAKPQGDLVLGLRKFCDGSIQTARAEAARFALSMHDDQVGQIEAYNDALMRWLVIAGTCDPNDTGVSAPVFEGSEENVRFALTAQAIRYLWDHIDAFQVEMNPVVPEIDSEDLTLLCARLLSGEIPENMGKAEVIRIRKFLSMVKYEIDEADGLHAEDSVTPG